jgi:ribosomal protein L32
MNIINKLGFKKHYLVAYSLAIIVIFAYSLLFFYAKLFILLDKITKNVFQNIPFLDLKLALFIFALLIVCVVFIILSLIKCPNCGNKFFWHWFNDNRQCRGNPFLISVCPNCGYDPDKEKIN